LVKKPGKDYRIKRPAAKKDLAFEVAAALDDCIEFHEGEKILMRTIAPATKGQRAVYSSYWYDYEVCNGGHHQFFWNSTGILWGEALAGLVMVGAGKYAAILKAAISLFPNGFPSKSRKKRMAEVEKIPKEKLERLDDSLYELEKKQSLDQILIRYIKANPGEFFIQ
jgi:hypothetical protein